MGIEFNNVSGFGGKIAEGIAKLDNKDSKFGNLFTDKALQNNDLKSAYGDYISAKKSGGLSSEGMQALANRFSGEFLKEDLLDDGQINLSLLNKNNINENSNPFVNSFNDTSNSAENGNPIQGILGDIFAPQAQTAYSSDNNTEKNNLIAQIIQQLMNFDKTDNGIANDGSVYTNLADKSNENTYDPTFINNLDKADNGQADGSVYKLLSILQDSAAKPEEKQKALTEIQNAQKNFISKNYDALTTGKTKEGKTEEGIGNEKMVTKNEKGQSTKWGIPSQKPEFVSAANWEKIKQLDPQMQAATVELCRKASEKGLNFNISSGRRSHEEQKRIYANARSGYAAKPGSSQHELGRAIDVKASAQTKQELGKIWEGMGYKWGQRFSKKEDWHFDLRPKS